jgi:hypothetical protein
LALTPNEEVNSLAALHLSRGLGKAHFFQFAPDPSRVKGTKPKVEKVSHELRGRILFQAGMTYDALWSRLEGGAIFKTTTFSDEFTYENFLTLYGASAVPLFLITEKGQWIVSTPDEPVQPKAGQSLMSLVDVVESAASPSK